MNTIKSAVAIACSILTLLLFQMIFIENPEKALYEKTIKTLMIQEGVSSYKEVMEYFPELREVESKMERIAYLSRNIQSLTGGLAPNVTRAESLQIQELTLEIQQLQTSVKKSLNQLLMAPAKDQL